MHELFLVQRHTNILCQWYVRWWWTVVRREMTPQAGTPATNWPLLIWAALDQKRNFGAGWPSTHKKQDIPGVRLERTALEPTVEPLDWSRLVLAWYAIHLIQ